MRLCTAYFTPDDFFVGLLCRTARRGVRVEALLPGPHTDKRVSRLGGRPSCQDLLDAGVRIAEYRPTMLHAKVATIDGVVSLVGSTNLNRRSLELDEEIMLAVLDEHLTATLDRRCTEDWAAGLPVAPGRWKRRPVLERGREAAVRRIRRFL